MAINFNKLFLQNLIPKNHSVARAQVSGFSSSEVVFNNSSSKDNGDLKNEDFPLETFEQQDRETKRLSSTLDSLRKLIDNHNRRKTGRETSARLHLRPRLPPSAPTDLHPLVRQKHRRSTFLHQPYQVDAAPACKDLSQHGAFRTNARMSRKSDKVTVEVRVVFLKIGEIDTLKEMYRADAFIQTKWPEPRLNGKTDEELVKVDLSKCWNPLVYIENVLTESKDQHWLSARSDAKGNVYVTESRRLRAIFLETLELNDFPLDVQDLTITLSSERPDTEVDLVPDNTDLCGINLQTFVDQQEWRLHEHVEITKQSIVQEFTSSAERHPFISVTCRAARRPGYFYWNVFLVMFFITGLSFATFSVSAERPENRLQLSFTLFLTSVAFKFVINQSLPKISYLTFMDKYVLMSLAILCKVSVWHAVVTLVPVYSLPDPGATVLGLATTADWNTASVFASSLHFGPNFPTGQGDVDVETTKVSSQFLDLFGQLPLINTSLHSNGNPPILLPRSMIPPWMNESFSEALRTDIYEPGMSSHERDVMVLKRAIDLTLKRRLLECQAHLRHLQVELKRLEERRTALLNRVERDVFVIFCLFYFACHVAFVYLFYFGASKRRREMVEKDKQFRTWLRKRRKNSTSSGPPPFINLGLA